MKLKCQWYGDIVAFYRSGTSDERVLTEVVEKACYRRNRIRFDVERGEHWLDLGANVGAFGVYCATRGAVATCYEPDPDNYKMLKMNVGPTYAINAAVTHEPAGVKPWYVSADPTMRHTGGLGVPRDSRMVRKGDVPTVCIADLFGREWDGVKMDIEGSEMGILDARMLPPCRKLVVEYHSRKDTSVKRLEARMKYLKEVFTEVHYRAEFDRLIESGRDGKTYFDRPIFCLNPLPSPSPSRRV